MLVRWSVGAGPGSVVVPELGDEQGVFRDLVDHPVLVIDAA
jgi:hypothetical protein